LGSARKSKTLYILDEPTVGLSFYDAVKLMELLDRLVEEGNTVLIIEHDPEILSYVDYLIELGPQGGPRGGYIIAEGTVEEVKRNNKSKTAAFLI
jgi:excinuclease UvrABC ATPase subunit